MARGGAPAGEIVPGRRAAATCSCRRYPERVGAPRGIRVRERKIRDIPAWIVRLGLLAWVVGLGYRRRRLEENRRPQVRASAKCRARQSRPASMRVLTV